MPLGIFNLVQVHNFESIVVIIQARRERARMCWVKKMELGLESEKALDGASSQSIASQKQRPWTLGGRENGTFRKGSNVTGV